MKTRRLLPVLMGTMLTVTILSCSPNQNKHSERTSETKQVAHNIKQQKGKVMELTTSEFKEKVVNYDANPDKWVFRGERPAVVDFYATWCGPCKMVAPIMEELAEKYKGQIDFYKVDVDKEQEVAGVFGIRSIPTMLFIPKEGQPTMSAGAMSYGDLDATVKKLLLK